MYVAIDLVSFAYFNKTPMTMAKYRLKKLLCDAKKLKIEIF